jgi:hypothetical protein
MDISDFPADELAKLYLKIRDAREELTKDYEDKYRELNEQLEVISEEMLELCKENGADSIRTPVGTIIRSVATRYWTNDWDSMYNFIKENDAHALLERRIHQSNMKQFVDENPDKFPPGMLVDSKYKIIVRRGRK